MTGNRPLDDKDLEILKRLQDDAWITHSELGEHVHLSASAVQRRIRRLREDGVITGARAVVDPARTGQGLRVYLMLELHSDSAENLETGFRADLGGTPQGLATPTPPPPDEAAVQLS